MTIQQSVGFSLWHIGVFLVNFSGKIFECLIIGHNLKRQPCKEIYRSKKGMNTIRLMLLNCMESHV